jgi:hypothetical protein
VKIAAELGTDEAQTRYPQPKSIEELPTLRTSEEVVMRIIALLVWTTVSVLKAGTVPVQTYGSEYPVCLQAYGDKGDYIECHYTSLAQCARSASGRSAECNINPYYRGPRQSPEGSDRRIR